MRNSNRRNDSVRTNCHGNRSYCTHMNYRESSCFNCFYHCCTATCTGTSSRGHDNCVNTVCYKFLSIFLSESFCRSYGCTVTNRCIEFVVKFSDNAFFFEFTHNVYRKYTVWIFVCIYRVISTMSCFVCLFCKIHNTCDVIFSVM